MEWLAELSKTMRDLVDCQIQLQAALASAVELEQVSCFSFRVCILKLSSCNSFTGVISKGLGSNVLY